MRSLSLSHGSLVAAAGHATGQTGTDRIALWFDGVLDNSYAALRNVELPAGRTLIDMILVGPPGIWAFYVETDPGQYRAEGDDFYAWDSQSGDYALLSPNPLEHIIYNEAQIRGWLNAANLPPECAHSAILFTDPNARVQASNSQVRLVGPGQVESLPMEIARLPGLLDEAAIQRAFAAIARGELPADVAPPRLRTRRRKSGLDRRQWMILGLLAFLNICILGGACALVIFLNQ